MNHGNRSRLIAAIVAGLWALVAAIALAQDEFDHFSTGFELTGAHANVECSRCHVGGDFQVSDSRCVSCHSSFGTVQASARPFDHVASSEICTDCHTTSAWSPVAFMDHMSVTGSCGSCHNGFAATGKPPDHVASSEQCDNCHSSFAWFPAVFDHLNVSGNCVSCHNGLDATGKNPGHIASGNNCEDCHSTIGWIPASFDHFSVTGNCFSCHNGLDATGKNPGHIASGNNCEDCHTTVAWTPANFDHVNISGGCSDCHNGVEATGKNPTHVLTSNLCETCHTTVSFAPVFAVDHDQVIGSCSSCHDGVAATGKDPGHFITAQECNVCHEPRAWFPDSFQHMILAYEPLDHRGNLQCTACHQNNAEPVIWPAAAYQPDCAGCHASDFRSGPHKKHENPDVSYTVGELRDCSGACHIYTDSSMTTIKENRPGPEHRISDGEF